MTAHPEAPHPGPDPATAPIPPEDRVPFFQKFSYAMGVVSDHYAVYGLNALAMPVFNVLLGLSPTMVSMSLAMARLWDAVTDPFVGSLSDNSKHRSGRRKPFIFVGAIVTGIVFPLIWLPSESWGTYQIFSYLCVALLLFYTGYSIFSVPYESLGMELTPDYRERTNVYVVRSYVEKLPNLGIAWLFAIANMDLFGNPLTGTRFVAIGVGIMIILSGVLPGLYCVERYQKVATHQENESALEALKTLRRNVPCVQIIAIIALFLLAMNTVGVLDFYMGTYYIYDGDIKSGAILGGYSGTVNLISGLFGAFLVQTLSRRFDKHHLLLGCLAILFLCKLGLYVTYIPGRPLLTFVTKPFATLSSTGFWILVISMRADVADWDEYVFGRRREGIIAAVGNWFVKVALTVSIVLGGVLLDYVIKFDRDLGGDQLPGTLERMKLFYVLIPASALLVLCVIVLRYPLTKQRLAEVRAELERRRQAV